MKKIALYVFLASVLVFKISVSFIILPAGGVVCFCFLLTNVVGPAPVVIMIARHLSATTIRKLKKIKVYYLQNLEIL